MKKEAILCPGPEHDKFEKKLMFKSSDAIFVHCKTHGWVEVKFLKEGKPISLEGTGVQISPAKWNFIDSQPIPTVSIGGFKKKCRQ